MGAVLEAESRTKLQEVGLQDSGRVVIPRRDCHSPGQDRINVKQVVQVDHELQSGMFFDWNDLGNSEVYLVDTVAPLTLSGRRKQRKRDASRCRNRPAKRCGNARRGGTGVRYRVIRPKIRRMRSVGICPTRGRARE